MSLRPVLQALVDAEAGRRRQRIPLEEVGPTAHRGGLAPCLHGYHCTNRARVPSGIKLCTCEGIGTCLQMA